MALDLARDHRVIVLAASEEAPGFASVRGIETRVYRTPDILQTFGPRGEPVGASMLAAASRIEREIGLPLHRAASNYLLYGRLVRGYGGAWRYLRTEADILRAYVGAYEELVDIFDRVDPDVVFYETIDLISSYVAFALARARGRFGLEFRFSPLEDGKIAPGFGIFRRNVVLEHLYAHPDLIEPDSYRRADRVLVDTAEHLRAASYARLHRRMLRDRSPFNLRRLLDAIGTPGALARGIRNIRWHSRQARNRLWLERHLSRIVPEEPYLAFFMQHLPEASTCSQAPRWVYQDMIVEQLAINAPSGLRVVVKEHPRSYGTRGRGFFGPLRDLPNVVLCHPSVDTGRLLAGAEAVIAITGSVGLEALLLGKRVGVLGRPFYSVYRGVRSLDHPDQIYAVMGDPAWRPEEMAEERRRFLAAYLQSLHDFGHGPGSRIYPEDGGPRWAHALRRTMEFIEARGLKPTDFEPGL